MKPFTTLACVLLSLIAILQLVRFILGWEVAIHGVSIPLWASAVAFVLLGGIALMVWRENRK